jgi:hypothetical protein
VSFDPNLRPTGMSDVASMVTAFHSARIKENTEYTIRLAALQADLKKRSELKKEMLFKISKIVEEIPGMLENNPIEGIMWINDIPDYLRENEIESSAFETLDFKELADKTWKKLDELLNHALTNLPDAVMAYEKAKAENEAEVKRKENEVKRKEQEKEAAERAEALRIGKEEWENLKRVFLWLFFISFLILLFVMKDVLIIPIQNLDYDLRQTNAAWARFRGYPDPESLKRSNQ